ncbi:MAG TPA: hypothetical protein VMT15_04375 [Bryobacteraceae bacterium]|nr:hypothetical protein [Bryobacteraceae bacterium]
MITDVLANASAANVSNEKFKMIKSAAAGEVPRGVSLAPTAASTMANVPLVLSAATSSVGTLAPGALASASGQNLAPG